MMKLLEQMSGDIRSSAKVVDGALILSLPDAVSPVVWRWNLGEAKASAIEVREGDNGHYTLILKTPRGDVQEIAPFDNKAKAMNALLAVSRAMENAHSNASYIVSNDGDKSGAAHIAAPLPRSQGGDGKKLLTGIGAVVLIIVLFTWLGSVAPKRMDTNISAGASATATGNASESSGVPVSADAFLSGR